jgi:DNA-binding MarR family transcriptional regulator
VNASGRQNPRAVAAHPATLLLRELIDVTDDFERSLGDELKVNPTDLTAMRHVISDGALSPSALAERLHLSSAAVTTVIDRLERVGHVSRTSNPDDRRGTLVVAAPDSVGLALGRILPMVAGVDDAIRAFDEQEQQVITRYLSRVVETYREHAGDSDRPRSWRSPDATPNEAA